MIKVALNGGLGNQLFQYAAGRALSVVNNTELCFDIIPLYSKLQLSTLASYRKFELDVFSIQANTNDFFFKNKYLYPIGKLQFFLNRYYNRWKYSYYRETDFAFDPVVLEMPDNTYLDGHFQSEKYFKSIESIISKELTFKLPLTDENNFWKQKIENSLAVSIHIRRGDYASLQKNLRKHGVVPLDYYYRAIRYLSAKITNPVFFIFTDDTDWVKDNFKCDFPFYIIENNNHAETSYADMHLMSLCSHQIIANSTFSWWGAWLNANPEKIVIAPENWFVDSSIDSKDIYPPEWIKL